jgi:hypothetical protein
MDRIVKSICSDMKEVKLVKNEAVELIKEIEFRATNPWEKRIYHDDKDDPYDYKYGICTLRSDGTIDDHEGWRRTQEFIKYKKFLRIPDAWVEDIKMLFCVIDNWEWTWTDYEKFIEMKTNNWAYNSWENDPERKTNHIKTRIALNFESYLQEDEEALYNTKKQYYEIVQYVAEKVDPSIETYMKNRCCDKNESVEYSSWSKSARLILKIRKEMINEGMKDGSKSLI